MRRRVTDMDKSDLVLSLCFHCFSNMHSRRMQSRPPMCGSSHEIPEFCHCQNSAYSLVTLSPPLYLRNAPLNSILSICEQTSLFHPRTSPYETRPRFVIVTEGAQNIQYQVHANISPRRTDVLVPVALVRWSSNFGSLFDVHLKMRPL